MSKKEDEIKLRENHPGSIAAEDEQLSLWLNQLWARGEPPERIEAWQSFGKNRRGEMIFHQDFRAGEKLDIEQANKLANEICAAAQNDCDSTRKESSYLIAIIDRNRKASPLVRRVGPLQPKRIYALAKSGDLDDDDGDELDAKALNLRYIKDGLDQTRWDKNRNDRVIGEMLLLQDNIIRNQQTALDRMFDKLISSFEKMQEAEDRKVQRDIIVKKEEFKLGLMKEGIRTARNLLPGLFAGEQPSNGTSVVPTNGNGNGHDAPKNYGNSPERTLVGNFLHDIEEEGEVVNVALFGDFEEHDGKLKQVKPGIFTIRQYGILLGVRDGRMPTAALDNLMPQSGHADAITQEQIVKASDAGVTEGIGMALMELVGLRQRAKEAANTATQETHA